MALVPPEFDLAEVHTCPHPGDCPPVEAAAKVSVPPVAVEVGVVAVVVPPGACTQRQCV